MAQNGTIAYVDKKPECDICKYMGNDSERESPARAEYDLKTRDGRWAFVCEHHRATHAMYHELGTGKGQRLELHPKRVTK